MEIICLFHIEISATWDQADTHTVCKLGRLNKETGTSPWRCVFSISLPIKDLKVEIKSILKNLNLFPVWKFAEYIHTHMQTQERERGEHHQFHMQGHTAIPKPEERCFRLTMKTLNYTLTNTNSCTRSILVLLT